MFHIERTDVSRIRRLAAHAKRNGNKEICGICSIGSDGTVRVYFLRNKIRTGFSFELDGTQVDAIVELLAAHGVVRPPSIPIRFLMRFLANAI